MIYAACQYFTHLCVQLSVRAFQFQQYVISIVLVFGGHPVYYIVVIIVFTVDDKIGFCLYYIILIAVNIANTMYI